MPELVLEVGKPGRRAAAAFGRALLLCLAFAIRAASLVSQGLWRDEVDQWRFALLPLREMIGNLTRPGWNGPLYSFVLRAWIRLTGETVYAMRLLSTLWAVVCVALFYVLVRRLAGKRTAGVAALIFACSPYMVWYAQEIKMYTWVPMLILLALYALDRACERPRAIWWLIVAAATTLAVYSHILAALFIPVMIAWFWLRPARAPRAWIGGLGVIAALSLPYLPLLSWQAAMALVPRDTGFPAHTLGQMITALLNGWSAGISQGIWGRSDALIGMMALWGVVGAVGTYGLLASPRPRGVLRLLSWLVLPIVAIWLVSLRGPIFTDRYLVWAAPAFYALVAAGLVWLESLSRIVARVSIAALLVVSGHGLYVQASQPIKPQFELAATFVEARKAEGDLLLFQIPYNHFVYDAYVVPDASASSAQTTWAEAPYTNWQDAAGGYQVDAAEVGREMRRIVAGYDRVWLIYSEASLWDERELVRGWLDGNYRLGETAHFTGVSVFLYTRPPH